MKSLVKLLLPVLAIGTYAVAESEIAKKALEFADAKVAAKNAWLDLKNQKCNAMAELMKQEMKEHANFMKREFQKLVQEGKISDADIESMLKDKVAFMKAKMAKFKSVHEKLMNKAKDLAQKQEAELSKFEASLGGKAGKVMAEKAE
jgi:hypothetical protein